MIDHPHSAEQVMARHRAARPDCPFIKNQSDNVPAAPHANNMSSPPAASDASVPITRSEDGSENEEQSRNEATDESQMEDEFLDAQDGEEIEVGDGDSEENEADDATANSDVVSFQPLPTMSSGSSSSSSANQAPAREASSSSSSTPMAVPTPRPDLGGMVTGLNETVRREEVRLRSFAKWPAQHVIRPDRLAKAGFVYTGHGDTVRCVFCGEYVGEWDPEDDPPTEHRNLFPHCPFVQGRNVGNVPIGDRRTSSPADADAITADSNEGEGEGEDVGPSSSSRGQLPPLHPPPYSSSPYASSSSGSSSASRMSGLPGGRQRQIGIGQREFMLQHSLVGEDEAGIRPRRLDGNSGPEKGPSVLRWTNSSKDCNSSGIIRHSGPAHHKHSTPEARLRTFRDWPPALRQQPKDLADAGFYYIGLSDQVKCFYCDGGLRNWQPEDDPWVEHSRWFAKCGFVRLVKGDEFIARCLASTPPETLPGQVPQSTSSTPASSSSSHCGSIDAEVQQQMSSPLAQQALTLGVDPARLKMALKLRAERQAGPCSNVDQLLQAVFNGHREQEERAGVENAHSPAAFSRTGAGLSASAAELQRTEDRASAALSALATSASSSEEPMDESSGTSSPSPQPQSQTSQPGVLTHSTSDPGTAASASAELKKSQSDAYAQQQAAVAQNAEGTALEQENRRLKEQRTCKICMDQEIGVVFLPCGHLICCVQCAPALKDCPLCRQPIHATVKTYLS